MFGLCFFDLLPDVIEMGGKSSLYIMGIVWLIYSLIHLFHLGHHQSTSHTDESHCELGHPHSFSMFCGSLITHGFASGMLLALSHELSTQIAHTVFLALVAHKGYEALMFSSILMKQVFSRRLKILLLGAYAFSLPAGVVSAFFLRAQLTQEVAMMMSSVAVGTLLACLIFDFMIPNLRQLRSKRAELIWMALGLLLTQLMMRQF